MTPPSPGNEPRPHHGLARALSRGTGQYARSACAAAAGDHGRKAATERDVLGVGGQVEPAEDQERSSPSAVTVSSLAAASSRPSLRTRSTRTPCTSGQGWWRWRSSPPTVTPVGVGTQPRAGPGYRRARRARHRPWRRPRSARPPGRPRRATARPSSGRGRGGDHPGQCDQPGRRAPTRRHGWSTGSIHTGDYLQ